MEDANGVKLDHYFIESAYYSELWALNDLRDKLQNSGWDFTEGSELDYIIPQIQDEQRHVAQTRNAMAAEGYTPRRNDDHFAMQYMIYKRAGTVDLSNTFHDYKLFRFMHEMLEKRAIWIYRTYLIGGKIESYKDLCRDIIRDEYGHLHELKYQSAGTNFFNYVDRKMFHRHLPKYYNRMNLVECPEFWVDYYGGNVVKL